MRSASTTSPRVPTNAHALRALPEIPEPTESGAPRSAPVHGASGAAAPARQRAALQAGLLKQALGPETDHRNDAGAPIRPQQDLDAIRPATPGLVTVIPARGALAAHEAQRASLHQAMRETGSSMRQLLDAARALNGKYVPSQSAGVPMASLNDVHGNLVLPFQNQGRSDTVMLSVVRATVPAERAGPAGGAAAPRDELFFIKGHGHRLVKLDDVRAFQAHDYDALPDEQRMETSFLTHIRRLSGSATLYARTAEHESPEPVMPLPPNAIPMPAKQRWANADNYLVAGFGGRPQNTRGERSAFDVGYIDYNAIENNLVIMLTDAAHHELAHPTQQRGAAELPASVNLNGSVRAVLQGIADVEMMGPAGKIAGVKLASLRSLLRQPTHDRHLRITTEDGAIHDLRYTPRGLQMALVQPKEAGADLLAPLPAADISVYSYQGRGTGLHGSANGFSNPEVINGTGDAMLAGPLLSNRLGWDGHGRSIAKLVSRLVTLDPALGARHAALTKVGNTALRAGATAISVYSMMLAVDTLRDPETRSLLGGAQPFSPSGTGLVDPGLLAGTIAVMVVAQDAVTKIYKLAHHTLLKDAWKSRESSGGQALNEVVLPMMGEFGRLLLNYGIQVKMGLPRGNGKDVASLVGVAAILTASNFVRGRAGNPQNHPVADSVFHTINFFLGDLMFRSLGAAAGNPDLSGQVKGIDYAEAFVTRMAARGIDKWIAPVLGTVLSAVGLLGPHATALDDQVTQEQRYNGAVHFLRYLGQKATLAGEELGEAGAEHLQRIETFASAMNSVAVLLEKIDKNINRLGLRRLDSDAGEVERTAQAAGYGALSDAARIDHLQRLAARFDALVAAAREPAPASGTADARAVQEPGPDVPMIVRAVSNNHLLLPDEMRTPVIALMERFAGERDAALADYPTRPSPDFVGAPLVFDARPSTIPGKKTERVPRRITTFSEAPAQHIANVHDKMASARGMPEKVEHSRPEYTRLSERMLREIRQATVKYTKESGFFHYLLRWANTGQPYVHTVVPGVHLVTSMMNRRGNVGGDAQLQVSPYDPLLINLGALHAEKYPAIVTRAVVTDARYLAGAASAPGVIVERDRVSLSEILSTTSAEQLAAAFLVALGYGAASSERTLKIVLHQDTAVNIAKYTELMQAETISLPGGVFVVEHIDAHPQPPEGGSVAHNLGQVVYLRRLDTYALENRYRAWQQARRDGVASPLAVDDLAVEPASGHFYRFDGKEMVFVIASKNYFLGTDIERDPGKPARWRYPFTSPATPRGMLDAINAALLMNEPIAAFLNDATRNVHHETDMHAGGYYQAGDTVKAATDRALSDMRHDWRQVRERIAAYVPDQPFPAHTGEAFSGALLAHLAAGALRKPLLVIAVDADGQPRQNADGPQVLARIDQAWDGVDLRWEKGGATTIGAGPAGYYVTGYDEGVLKCAPVQVEGHGATPGNLLHTIMASAFPNPQHAGYQVVDGVVRSAGNAGRALPRLGGDAVKAAGAALLERFKRFASQDYIPLQSWLSAQAGGRRFPAPDSSP